MSAPTHRPSGLDPQERWLRRSWAALALALGGLAVAATADLWVAPRTVLDLVLVALVAVVGATALAHRAAVRRLTRDRNSEAESVARILQGLSRSVSPDAIVDAIVEELGGAAGADHMVVVCHRADTRLLEARLVSSRPGVARSTTRFPLVDLEDPWAGSVERTLVAVPIAGAVAARPLEPVMAASGVTSHTAATGQARIAALGPVVREDRQAAEASTPDGPHRPPRRRPRAIRSILGEHDADDREAEALAGPTVGRGADGRIAERIAARARAAYGLRNTLSAPLRADDRVVGAIVLSRRVDEPWPASARRILAGAATEASAALARAALHRDAETRASTDGLTGLPNRRYFDEFCALLARRRRADDAVGVLLIDIDHFKSVNDTWGHTVGDEVLVAVGRAIAGAVREEDVPARYGGEEFAVLLRNPSGDVATEVGERVRAAVGRLDLRALGPRGVTVSVGVAIARTPDEPIARLVEAADRALYRAKTAGRNRVVAAD